MGTPDFAEKSLRALCARGHDIAGVFTQPDRPRGRGRRVTAGPVKDFASQNGIEVFQPETLRDGSAVELLKRLSPELIAVVAYGKLLPPDILALPERGCVNIHGSLLPKYRGAAPVQRAIMGGESTTGVTSIFMAPELDAGDVIMATGTDIRDGETFGQLYARLGDMGAELLAGTVEAIAGGLSRGEPQDGAMASFAPPIDKDSVTVNWRETADEIVRRLRALDPRPAAAAQLGGTRFKLFSGRRADGGARGAPGEVLREGPDGLVIACGDGAVLITELQAPGGVRMRAGDYLRGHGVASARGLRT
jgi:methionyl-tRNA formyltransferase